MTPMNFTRVTGAVIAMTAALNALASIPAIEFDIVDGQDPLVRDQNVGWRFNVVDPILVDRLAFYDAGGDGLITSHSVGIWNPDGSLIMSVVIPAGIAADIHSGWRYVEITPFELAVDNGYIMGAETFLGSDVFFGNNAEPASIISQIEYVGSTVSSLDVGFVRPSNSSSSDFGWFGAGFFVVPAPSSLGLLAIGGLAAARRRR